jgi:hypothetical protein
MKSLTFIWLFAVAALAKVSPDGSCGGTKGYTCPVCLFAKLHGLILTI